MSPPPADANPFLNENLLVRYDFEQIVEDISLGDVFPNVATGPASVGEDGVALLEGGGTITVQPSQPTMGNAAFFGFDGFTYLTMDPTTWGNVAGPTGMTISLNVVRGQPINGDAPAWLFSGAFNVDDEGNSEDDFGVRIQSGSSGAPLFNQQYRAAAGGGGENFSGFFGGGTVSDGPEFDHVTYVVQPAGASQYIGQLYLNGLFNGQSVQFPLGETLDAAFIGAWANGGAEWRLDGELIDEFRIYNKAFTAEEVATLSRDLGNPGDFNIDGEVNAADYTLWRDSVGRPAGALFNDTAGGMIGIDQYNLWRANYGGGVASVSETSIPTPEPCSLFAAALVVLAASPRHSRLASRGVLALL